MNDEMLIAAVHTALRRVPDPELAESIVDLGLIDAVTLADGQLTVRLIPTSATCPMADVLIDDVAAALQPLCPDGIDLRVDMDWDATWTPERMSPALRQRFGW